jgi:hypothetical protein
MTTAKVIFAGLKQTPEMAANTRDIVNFIQHWQDRPQ